MRKIKLTKDEYQYLVQTSFLPHRLQKLILSDQKTESEHVVTISTDQADEIRDLCAEKLQFIGFDEQYRPTSDGITLESLIEKFFIG